MFTDVLWMFYGCLSICMDVFGMFGWGVLLLLILSRNAAYMIKTACDTQIFLTGRKDQSSLLNVSKFGCVEQSHIPFFIFHIFPALLYLFVFSF